MDWKLRPARDFGLSLRERLGSLRRELGFLGTATHWLWRQVVRLYLRCFHRLRIEGREHLPAPPFVMIANHASHLDTLTLASVLPLALIDRVHPIAAEDTFFTSFASSAFAAFAVNALPLRRRATKRADLATLRTRLLEEELVFILFPEGTRSRDGSMGSFKPGIGALVAGSAVQVVPCYLEGAFAALPPHRHLPRPTRLNLRIGLPLTFADLANGREGWSEAAERCEAAVRRLCRDTGIA